MIQALYLGRQFVYFNRNMKKIKALLVQFENDIPANRISSFRGAIIEKVGRENILFHQHKDDTSLVYSYPMIQYKIINKHPAIVCLGDGVEEIHKLFEFKKWDIQIQDEKILLKILRLDLKTITLNVWDKMFSYDIRNWLALNKENYEKYLKEDSLAEKCRHLEKILTANILSFAKGVEWIIDKPVLVQISNLKAPKIIRYKGVPLAAFDVAFKSNVYLPTNIGLGKSVSHGFGILRMNRQNDSEYE